VSLSLFVSLATALALGVAVIALWLLSLRLRDASIADVFWGPSFALVVAVALAVGGGGPRGPFVAVMVGLWAARLALHIAVRRRGHGEDRRYAAMRRRDADAFRWTSLPKVFLLQGGLAWVLGAPLVAAILSPEPLGPLDLLGAVVWLAGFACEAVADEQLRRFRASGGPSGRVLDTGLWAWTRHPNYFGETVLWWGFWVVACAAGAWWTVWSPCLVTFLLLRVSGVTLLEPDLVQRRPAYAAYARAVPTFLPRPPRRTGEGRR